MKPKFKILLPSVVTAFILVSSTGGVAAHTALVSSNPVAGSTVTSFPKVLQLTFNEKLLSFGATRSNYFDLISPDGQRIQLGEIDLLGSVLRAGVLQDVSVSGTYRIEYRVVSGDGHVVRGEVKFAFSSSISDDTTPIVKEEFTEDSNRESVALLSILIALVALSGFVIYFRSNQST
jgi:methionine-rich copper-binding protein CopC